MQPCACLHHLTLDSFSPDYQRLQTPGVDLLVEAECMYSPCAHAHIPPSCSVSMHAHIVPYADVVLKRPLNKQTKNTVEITLFAF